MRPNIGTIYYPILQYTHTQYRHTHLHQIWEKLSKYKQALINTLNHIDTHLWTHLKKLSKYFDQAASLTVKLKHSNLYIGNICSTYFETVGTINMHISSSSL